ncbi:MAG: hypothetical protein H0W69_03280 [Gemmatimonadaceae bacterium]|nr:hypothetical protein [Gemmatimonadaceae bacterium]
MAINTGKVAIAGIGAGVVLALIDWVVMKFITGPIMTADMNNFKVGAGDAMNAPGAWMGMVFMDVLMGILIVWLYAAIRPRFGPGMKTAVSAALFMWIVGSFFTSTFGFMGMMTWNHWFIQAVIWLVTLIIVASVGGRLYSEDGATA